jgi:hypothetical protein
MRIHIRHLSFRLPKHPDNLLNSKTIPLHPGPLSDSDSERKLTSDPDRLLGVRSMIE